MRNILFLLAFSWGAAQAEAGDRLLHTAIDSTEVDQPLRLKLDVQGAGQVASLRALVRDVAGGWHALPFERVAPTTYQATVPAVLVAGPHLAYAIEATDRAGQARYVFADREAHHHVDVVGRGRAAEAAIDLARYRGQRNALRSRVEVVAFGGRRATSGEATDDYSEGWLDVSAEYIYRPLSIVHDIRFRAGFMRASAAEVDGESVAEGPSPGLNHGSAEVTLELHRWWTIGGRLLLGANEDGFVVGFGGVMRVGDLTANHLAIGIESVGEVGTRTDLRFHWTTVPRVPMALGATFTTWPDDNLSTGTLLAYDLGLDLTDHSQISLRVGAANRAGSLATGLLGGLGYQHSF